MSPRDNVTRRWTVMVENAGIQSHTYALQAKDGCFVSAHTKLAGWGKAVVLTTRELAEEFRDAIYPVMRQRHGEQVELTVEPVIGMRHGPDDAIVRARMAEKNYAPNKQPAQLGGEG